MEAKRRFFPNRTEMGLVASFTIRDSMRADECAWGGFDPRRQYWSVLERSV